MYIKTKNCKKQSISLTVCLISFIILVLVLFFVSEYGKWRILKTDKEAKTSEFNKIAVIQGNIDQAEKWDIKKQMSITKKYIYLSDSVKKAAPDLVIWPETATPFYFTHNAFMTKMVTDSISKQEALFLIGSPSASKTDDSSFAYFNSAYLIHPDTNIIGKYDKVHLVPFGEYVPFKKWFPFLGKMVQQIGDFTPGNIENILGCKKFTLAVQICYEIIFPQLSRSIVKNNALFIINITNDAWFGNTSAPYQHFAMAILRAVENKRTLIRAANTGISGYIDPVGRIISSSPVYKEKTLVQKVPALKTKTFYTNHGDIFALSCLVLTFCLLIIIYYKNIFK
jgi:apolipoprotein N-acyltransferase